MNKNKFVKGIMGILVVEQEQIIYMGAARNSIKEVVGTSSKVTVAQKMSVDDE